VNRRRALGAVLVALVAALLVPGGVYAARGAGRLSVRIDRVRISTKLGYKFDFRSTITNHGSTAASGMIAHLNILSLRKGVYVDPEDWSTHRTVYLGTIAAGESRMTTWHMQAVNAGHFGIYVAVLPDTGAARPPTTGPAISLAVAGRRTLNSGGILPLALGIPALLGFSTLAFRLYRARR
jgi:hypothetical protein